MRYAFYLDIERCVGCYACAVACMDQNDLELGAEPTAWRQVFTVESCLTEAHGQEGPGGPAAKTRIRYVSLACLHCEDAPCILACPTGAIRREPSTWAVTVSQDLCIGCHSCSIACPFGAPRFDSGGTMQKCNLCSVRLENGLEPACVRVCPTGALQCGNPNLLALEVQSRAARRYAASS